MFVEIWTLDSLWALQVHNSVYRDFIIIDILVVIIVFLCWYGIQKF